MDEFWAKHSSKHYCPVPPPPHPTYDVDKVVQAALDEDDGGIGDATTLATIDANATAKAIFTAKATGVVAGLALVDAVFAACDPNIETSWAKKDGDPVGAGDQIGVVTGDARAILRGERVALNFMQRMSGIARTTRLMVDACKGTKATMLDTRKTAPGLRVLDKWAVLIGGGSNHRIGLYDMIMIKDNHIKAAGGLVSAVEKAKSYIRGQADRKVELEVEVSNMEEVKAVMECLKDDKEGLITRVMLDNMVTTDEKTGEVDVSDLTEAVRHINAVGPLARTEASGNVTLASVAAIAQSRCDFISCGALTHSVQAMDVSFNIDIDGMKWP